MAFEVGVVCSIGSPVSAGGRERNEDNFLICANGKSHWRDGEQTIEKYTRGEGVLVAVCDGMGGHEHGDAASRKAARVMAGLYRPGLPRDPARALRRYLLDAHGRLHFDAREKGPVTMGTTLTSAWVLGSKVHWAHVGDTRLYLFRGGQLRQLTEDHTRNLFRVRDGMVAVPEGEHLAQAFLYGSRGLGDNAGLRIEHGRDTGSAELCVGDQLILASDGAYRILGDADLTEILAQGLDAQAAAQQIVDEAIRLGTTDNATVIVITIEDLESIDEDTDAWGLEEDTLML